MAQDDYYYEIQLTNKQLVFYFMAGAAGLILSFLAGVMVGRGVDSTAGEVQAARPVEERIVTEEPTTQPAPPAASDLTYAQRLEGEKLDNELKPAAGASGSSGASASQPQSRPSVSRTAAKDADRTSGAAPPPAKSATPKPVTPKAVPTAVPAPAAGPASFTIQVGAFKDKGTADDIAARLKGKGFAAYVVTPDGANGLFNVRVGSYPARADAERIQAKLRDEEKFKPFIVKN